MILKEEVMSCPVWSKIVAVVLMVGMSGVLEVAGGV